MGTVYAAGESLSIHLSPPILGYAFGIPITSTLLMTWFTMCILIIFAVYIRSNISLIPNKLQIATESLVGGVFDYIINVLESRYLAQKFFPLIMSIFIFVLSLNWFGLLPGVGSLGVYKESHLGTELIPFFYPANTDLNITIGFALVAFIAIEISGIVVLGLFKYGSRFINFSSPLAFLVGIIEIFSELARLISFSFRLFGNIFAGKTLILIAMFFIPFVIPVPLLAFELFVGFIQAFIFAVLTLFFIKLAVADTQAH